jgi:hypothetical protein
MFLNSGDIGHTRPLQTQANTLTAETNGGYINITNGVRAPTTLNIGILQASSGIVLANNGTMTTLVLLAKMAVLAAVVTCVV